MNTPYWFSDLAYWSAQVALLVLAAGFLPHIFKIRQPRVLLIYWRALIVVSLLLPFAQPWHQSESFANINFAPRIGEFTPIVIATSAPAPHWHFPSAQIIAEIIGLIILAGIAARFTILALGLIKLRQFRQSSSPISNHAESSAVLDDMRVRVNTVGEFRLSSDVSSPVTFGLTAPVILLPERFPTLHAQYQSAIACHELLHVRRRDWAHHLSEEILRAALWFHPAIAWLIARIRLSREQVVDLEVIKLTDARKPYLEALLEFTNSRALATAIPAPPFLVEGQLAERVALMLKEVRMSRTRLIASLTAIAVSLAVVATLVVWTFPLKAAPRISLPPIQSTDKAVIQFVRDGAAGGVTVFVPNGVSVGVTVGGPARGVPSGVVDGPTTGVPGGITGNFPSQGVKGGVSGGVNTNGRATLTDSYVGPSPADGPLFDANPARKLPLGSAPASQPAPKIVVTDIKFEGEVHDADAVRARVLKGIAGHEWDGSNNQWLDVIAEVGVRGDFQDHGYFEVNVEAEKFQVVDSTPTQQRVVAIFNVKEGDRFTTGDMTFVNGDPETPLAVSESELRQQIQLAKGDWLSTDQFRKGIGGMIQLFKARGYTDVKIIPAFSIDRSNHSIGCTFTVHQGTAHPAAPPQSALGENFAGKFQPIPPATASSQKFQPIPPVTQSVPRGLIVGQPATTTNQGVFVNVAPSAPATARTPNSQNISKPVYRAGENGISMPKCIFCPKPEYSDDARDAKLQGTTYLQVTVLRTGRAGEIKVIKSFEKSLDEQAIKVVREKWTFAPATDQNGDPVDVIVPIEIAFQFYGPPQPTPPPANPAAAKIAGPPLTSSESVQTKIFTGSVMDNGATAPSYMGLVNTQTLYAPQPERPRLARQANVQGPVTLNIVVNTEGKVIVVEYVKGPAMLAQTAIDAVRNWIIKGTHDGAPVAFQMSVEVAFNDK
jgi:TonB family protein